MAETDNHKIIDLLYRINYFPGVKKLITIVHKANKDIPEDEINDFYNKDISTQLTKQQPITQKPTGHVVSYHLNELWQMDIFDLSRYKYFNKANRYILVAIDVFSRKAFAIPWINKDGNTVKEAFIKMTKDIKPRCIISDHDAAFLSNEFSSYLDKLQIPLNVNALGDHHVLGIIDNFAKRIKTILTAMFLKNNNTRWIHVLDNTINHYTRSENEALNGLSPDAACREGNKPQILDINIEKNKQNKMVSDLTHGDEVRKNILFNDKHSKGSDPKWSEKVFTVASTHGNTVILNDRSIYKRQHLFKVANDAQDLPNNPIREAKRINKEIDKQARDS